MNAAVIVDRLLEANGDDDDAADFLARNREQLLSATVEQAVLNYFGADNYREVAYGENTFTARYFPAGELDSTQAAILVQYRCDRRGAYHTFFFVNVPRALKGVKTVEDAVRKNDWNVAADAMWTLEREIAWYDKGAI